MSSKRNTCDQTPFQRENLLFPVSGMVVLRGLEAVTEEHREAVLTIGNFDGLHVGHQKILRNVVEEARSRAVPAMAVTFEPHPLKLLHPDRAPRLITTGEEKARLLLRYGMDAVLVIEFTREFARLTADEFIESVLVNALSAQAVIVGHNYAFGKGKQGSAAMLRRRGRKYGFTVKVVRNAMLYGKPVSSSRVRLLLTLGKVAKAGTLLGRPFTLEGTVVKGAGRGAKLLDTPTANIETRVEAIPKEGVYAVRAALAERKFGEIFDGVANIGTNPTFGGTAQSIEVHLFGYRGNLKGKGIRVGFIERLRDEHRFPSARALHEQIVRDIGEAKEVLRTRTTLKM
jgi:riboflavin kinase/FMN adenylyltransferase